VAGGICSPISGGPRMPTPALVILEFPHDGREGESRSPQIMM